MAQQRQALADVVLSERFHDAAGRTSDTSSRAASFGYEAGSLLMRRPRKDRGLSGSGKPAGIPVKSDELVAYGRRTLRPGQVQTFGAVLLVNLVRGESTFGRILAVSANAKDVLGVEASQLLDSDIFSSDVSPFDTATLDALRTCFSSPDPAAQAPLIGTLCRVEGTVKSKTAFLIAHTTEEGFVIDVEPISGDVSTLLQGCLQTHSLAKASVARLHELASASWQQQCQVTCEETRALTGFDRVMMYKFHPDQHGEVVAESFSSSVSDRYLGLHFPATDIPQANRNIFMQMRSRMIASVGAPSAKMVQSPRLSENIILANSQLRGVSGCHAQYLQNMGVQATLVIAIVTTPSTDPAEPDQKTLQDGRPPKRSPLWGLMVCHHYSGPHRVSYDHRAAVEFVAKVFALQLGRALDAEAQHAQKKVLQAQSAICDVIRTLEDHNTAGDQSLASSLYRSPGARVMLQLAGASGCAMLLNGSWHTAGRCPDEANLNKLVSWLREEVDGSRRLPAGGHWGTINLHSEGFSGAESMRDVAAGILAVDVGREGAEAEDQVTLWMRGEMIQEVTWAGNNESPQARAKGHEMSPRESFDAMKALIEFECSPWSAHEVDGTHAIKLLLRDALRLSEEGQTTSRILVALNQERLRNMTELTKLADELKAVIETADVPMIKLDANLCITHYNSHARHYLTIGEPMRGKEGRNALGLPLIQYLDASSHARATAALQNARMSNACEPFPVKFITGKQNQELRDLPRSLNNEALLFVHVKRSLTGDVEELVIICRDTTSQAELMKQVEARERDCEELLHNSASPMFSVDTNGRITEWNPAMVQLTGLEPFAAISKVVTGEIFGPRGLLKLMPSEGSSTDAETEISVLLLSVMEPDRVVADGVEQAELGAVDFCFAKSTSSGLQQVDIRLTCHQRVGSTGEMVGVYFYVQDLTLPKALEKAIAVQMAAEAAAEAKTRHIAFLCHEIRNPVNGILATVQAMDDMMLEDPKRGHSAINEMDAEELRDLVRTTLACTDQLRRTVDGILDINKLEEGKLDVAIGPFKAKSVLRTVCSQVKRAATEKGLTLDFELDPPELGSIWFLGDEGRIQQILSNFCWNSVKFTSEGGVRIVVEAEDGEHPGTKRVFWKVIDTGKGMTPETQESLFQRYAMGNHKVGKYGGSGLGLSICRSLADLMNGHVHCVSTLGKGSTFVLELDLEVDSQSHSVENQHITPGDMEEFRSSAAVARNARDESGGVCTKDKVLKPHQAVSSTSEAPMAGAQDVSPMSAVSSAQNQSASWPYQGQQPTSQPHPMTYAHPGPNWMEQPAAQFGPNMIYFDPPHMVHPSLALQQAVARLDAHSMMYMPSWSVSVVRELIHETSVAVLVELNIAGAQRQCWGGAQIGPAGVGHALAEANEDAILRGSTLIQAPWTPSPAYAFYPPEIPQTGGTIPVFSQDLAPSVFNRSVQQQVTMKPPSNVGDARVPLSCSQGEQHSLASAPLQHAPVQAPSRHGGVPASLPDGIPNVVQKMPELARPGSMPSQTQVASNSEGPSVVAAPSESLTPSNAAGPMLSSTQTDESSPDQPNSKCSNLKPRRKKLALKRPDASKADAAAASIQPGEEGAPMISVSGCAAPGSGGEANGIATTKLKWLLIVDDDAVNTKMMHRTFTRAGYDVTTGEDGGDVLRLCITEDRRYDIILLDENMRHMNGTVAARALRIHEKQRGIQHVPIIMTTGNTSPHDVAMYFSCGVDGVIEKPIDMRSFPQQLESYYAYRMASGAANFAELPLIADDCPRPTMGKPMARRNSEIFEQSMTFGSIEIFGNIKEGRGADAMQAVLSRFQGYEQRRRE